MTLTIVLFTLLAVAAYCIYRVHKAPISDNQKSSENEKRTVGSMKIGDKGWTVPWALGEKKGKLMLNPDHLVYDSSGGTVSVFVIRKEDGYCVWIPDGSENDIEDDVFHATIPVAHMYAEKPAEAV